MITILGMNDPSGLGPLSPDDGAGKRLFELSGMTLAEYDATFRRVNLVANRFWSRNEAKIAARSFRKRNDSDVVVLGKEVWSALGLPATEWFDFTDRCGLFLYYLVPHPSGRNLVLNDAKTRDSFRHLLRSLR